MKTEYYCKFCLKFIEKPVFRNGKTFCNQTCYQLFQHSETFTLPPYPKENPFVGDSDHEQNNDRGFNQPFDKEML